MYTPGPGGARSTYGITSESIVKASGGVLYRVVVSTAGSTSGAVYDSISTSGNSVSNLVMVIPNTVGVYELLWPCNTGIVIAPGTSQVVSASWT